jgi:carbon-monoxide dehydrogenase medium subunit
MATFDLGQRPARSAPALFGDFAPDAKAGGMQPFDIVTATDSRHAQALMAEHGPPARILAGGTDLLVDLKSAADVPRLVIDISRAADLKGIDLIEDGLRIGALVTHAELMRSPLVRELLPALVEAAHSIGAVQTRNLGTLGGNLMSCIPSMDSGPALVALDARVTVAHAAGRRQMPLTQLFVGPRRTSLAADELLVEIVIPRENLGKPCAFEKFGLRKGQALALVNVAAAFRLERGGTFAAPRIALGAVAPTVMHAGRAQEFLDGRPVTAQAMAEAGRIAADEAAPISDFRASAHYRRDLIAVLTRRALDRAFTRARQGTREGAR